MNKYDCLDLDVIRSEIASLSFIEDSRKIIQNEEVEFNPLIIRKNLTETKEAMDILKKGIDVSFDGILNIDAILEKADKGIVLVGSELNTVLAVYNHSERIKKQFTQFDQDLSIRDYTDAIMLNSELYNSIDKAIDTTGAVKDDASPDLKKIISELSINENRLMDKANQFIMKNTASLQEPTPFVRNNRVCFLVRNMDKNKFGGYSYGSSSSGQAQYVEPGNFIDLNNAKASLEEQKEGEIFRILSSLTYLVKKYSEDLKNNYLSLVKLAVIFAKARYGTNHDGIIAEISNNEIELKNICHPLIDSKKVVSNSYSLKEPYQGIVISGSNTGGKTVSLKLIGLSVILSYLGIPLIAESAKVPFFSNVFVDMDDNQSISSSLSTFSAHISNINSILKNADSNSLILIDELISGTDPKEAQAISLAIIEKMEEIGARFVITTHFDDIKNYAYEDERIMLSSVGFDTENLIPTYKYYENTVGSSNALDIARRYFEDETLIHRTEKILVESQNDKDRLMNELSNETAKNKRLNEELEKTVNESKIAQKQLNEKINAFENEKKKLREEYISKLNEELEETRRKAEELLSQVKNNSHSDAHIARKKLDELAPVEEKKEEPLKVGDSVRINENDSIGQITEINGNSVTVAFNGLMVRTKLKDLHKVNTVATKKKYVEKKRTNVNKVPHELNLVGKRVEEAIDELEVYLDNAYSLNYTSVRIIHGIGTGALRKGIHERLKKIRIVSSFKLADYDNGGSAITIVEFRK